MSYSNVFEYIQHECLQLLLLTLLLLFSTIHNMEIQHQMKIGGHFQT